MTLGLVTRAMPEEMLKLRSPRGRCCQITQEPTSCCGSSLRCGRCSGNGLRLDSQGQVPAPMVTFVLCFNLLIKTRAFFFFSPDVHLSRFCFTFRFIYVFLHKSKKKAQKQFGRKGGETSLAEPCTSRSNNWCLALKIAFFLSPDTQGCGLGTKLFSTIWPRLFFIS